MKHISFLFLPTIFIATFFFRSFKLSTVPFGLYIDETSIGYNAFSIVSTGKDEYGKKFPLFFAAFGEYKLPVYIYSVALVQLIAGPTDLSVRLPALIYGLLSVIFVYYLTREVLEDAKEHKMARIAPYLSALTMGLSPWHYMFSRAGFEASAAIFFLILGTYLFFLSLRKKSSYYFCGFVASFVLSLYSYNSARIVAPIIFLVLIVTYWRRIKKINFVLGLVLGFIISLPFLIFVLSPEGFVRAKQVSIFYQQSDISLPTQFIVNYWKNISPYYLFWWGDPTIAHLTTHRMSLIYLVDLPFFILGLWYLLKRHSRVTFLVLTWLMISIVPSAISTLNPHALRSSLAIPAVCIICAVGVSYLISLLADKSRKIVLASYVAVVIISAFNFLFIYQNKYAVDSGWDWQAGIKSAVGIVTTEGDNYHDIYFDDGISKTAVLWYLKFNPTEYQHSQDKDNIGSYHFWTKYAPVPTTSHKSLFVTTQPSINGIFKGYVYFPNGSVAYGIWEI